MPHSASIRVICFGTFVLGLTLLGATISLRIASRWPLEWMEGASLQHALRILHGEPLYAAPSAEFIPFVYPPLAYLPVALFAGLLGPSLWIGRLVSVLALAGALACVFVIVRRSTGSAALGGWAAGVYSLGFGYTGAFGDLVRVDSVFMLLVLLGIERLSAKAMRTGLAFLVLSCFAKQHGVLFLVGAGVALAARERRTAALPLAAATVALAIGIAGLQLATGGYFWTYIWTVPRGHGIVPRLLLSYFGVDVLVYLPCLALFVVLGSTRARLRPTPRESIVPPGEESGEDIPIPKFVTSPLRPRVLSSGGWASALGGGSTLLGWALLAAGLIASALGRAHPGGHDNVRMPGFAVLVLAAGTAFPYLWTAAQSGVARAVYGAALVLQPLFLLQLPALHQPSKQTARQFEALRASLRRCAGGDLSQAVALDHALLTGRPFLHTMALSDVRQSSDAALSAAATHALVAGLSGRKAPASVAVSSTFPELDRALQRNYERCDRSRALRLATGYELGPTTIYRRRDLSGEAPEAPER
jgi:4-amino-4-deoxy-L-arabinose transferase-like glycosyltransferase